MVPEKKELTELEVLQRIKVLYGRVRSANIGNELKKLREDKREHDYATLLTSYTHRMYDLSEFMKMLMQRFTQFYNHRHERRGPLWEDRFKSILVEGKCDAISVMAAYIDLNPVRAGIVAAPELYHFSGYGEAVAGSSVAMSGIRNICKIMMYDGTWNQVASFYRKHIFMQAEAHKKNGSAISSEKIQKVLDSGGKLSRTDLMHCKVRYFSDGVVLGGKVFVEDVYHKHRKEFGLKRKSGARKLRQLQSGELCTMRDLRVAPISVSDKNKR